MNRPVVGALVALAFLMPAGVVFAQGENHDNHGHGREILPPKGGANGPSHGGETQRPRAQGPGAQGQTGEAMRPAGGEEKRPVAQETQQAPRTEPSQPPRKQENAQGTPPGQEIRRKENATGTSTGQQLPRRENATGEQPPRRENATGEQPPRRENATGEQPPRRENATNTQTGQQTPRQDDQTGSVNRSPAHVHIDQQQQIRIRQVIRTVNVTPQTNIDFNVNIGVAVPHTIHFYPLPPEIVEIVPEYRDYEFFEADDEVVIVDPRTFEIVYIIPLA